MAALIGRTGRVAAGAVLLVLAAALVRAQDAPVPAARPAAPPEAAPNAAGPAPTAAPTPSAPVPPPSAAAAPPDDADAPASAAPDSDEAVSPRARAAAPAADPTRPVRAPVAILRVLDKVSAQSMAFAAPVGQRVRYRSLVFEVKACETLDPHEPEPRTSAYLLITSDAGASAAGVLGPRQVFKGWMFADSPSVRPFKHPVYDAWLVACAAAPPA